MLHFITTKLICIVTIRPNILLLFLLLLLLLLLLFIHIPAVNSELLLSTLTLYVNPQQTPRGYNVHIDASEHQLHKHIPPLLYISLSLHFRHSAKHDRWVLSKTRSLNSLLLELLKLRWIISIIFGFRVVFNLVRILLTQILSTHCYSATLCMHVKKIQQQGITFFIRRSRSLRRKTPATWWRRRWHSECIHWVINSSARQLNVCIAANKSSVQLFCKLRREIKEIFFPHCSRHVLKQLILVLTGCYLLDTPRSVSLLKFVFTL
jgi:hypothetical protein